MLFVDCLPLILHRPSRTSYNEGAPHRAGEANILWVVGDPIFVMNYLSTGVR